jgi:hypothetical protein
MMSSTFNSQSVNTLCMHVCGWGCLSNTIYSQSQGWTVSRTFGKSVLSSSSSIRSLLMSLKSLCLAHK